MKDVYLLSSNITHLLTFIKAGQGASYSQGFQMPDRNENTEVMENIRRLATSLKTSPAVINNIDNAYLSDLKNIFNKVIEERDDNGRNNSTATSRMTSSLQGTYDNTSVSIPARMKPAVVSPNPYKKKHQLHARTSLYSNGYSGNTTKLYYFVIGTYVVVYFAKGSATGGLGWFRDPQNKIQGDLLKKNSLGMDSLAASLNIVYVLPLRDRELSSVEKPMEFPWKAGRKLFSFAFIHEGPEGTVIGEEYASDYAKHFITVIMKHFPSYKLYIGGNAVEETGEAISSLDDIFMKNDVARFISKCYRDQIDDGSFFMTRDMNEFIRRHPNPEALVKYVCNMQDD